MPSSDKSHKMLSDTDKLQYIELLKKQQQLNISLGQELIQATEENDVKKVAYLISAHCADVNAKEYRNKCLYDGENKKAPLHIAAKKGHLKLVQWFMEQEAVQVDSEDRVGCTALHMAVLHGHVDIVKCLLEADANPNIKTKLPFSGDDQFGSPAAEFTRGCTPLHLAAATNQKACIEALINGGADPNITDAYNRTSLHVASKHREGESMVLLHIKGAMGRPLLEFPDTEAGRTALFYCVQNKMFEGVEQLILLGSDVGHSDVEGITPLYLACCMDDERAPDLVRLMLAHGFNPDLKGGPKRHNPPGRARLLETVLGMEGIPSAIPQVKSHMRQDMAAILLAYGAPMGRVPFSAEGPPTLVARVQALSCRQIPNAVRNVNTENGATWLNELPNIPSLLHLTRHSLREKILAKSKKGVNGLRSLRIPETLKSAVVFGHYVRKPVPINPSLCGDA